MDIALICWKLHLVLCISKPCVIFGGANNQTNKILDLQLSSKALGEKRNEKRKKNVYE